MALLPGGGGLLELVTPAGNDFGSDADLLAWPLGAGPARVVAHLGSLPNSLVVSGDGKVAAAPTDQFNGMRAWDLPDGTMRGSWLSPDTGIASLIGPMAISRQGDVLAGVGASRNITVARAGEPAARLLLQPGTASRLDTVALSSDGALVAAGTVFAEGAFDGSRGVRAARLRRSAAAGAAGHRAPGRLLRRPHLGARRK